MTPTFSPNRLQALLQELYPSPPPPRLHVPGVRYITLNAPETTPGKRAKTPVQNLLLDANDSWNARIGGSS
ncbi:hypothetical protein SAMN00790413_04314 [Deinococcus hopiensis KR-140]|uniref:Uncharacterized protein n=1 Tax=Deinococcus hopiensis KR-140 TaxID=695939 RepID=A0A1W1UQ43_9DEIO|nr:hypothetical protein SAMN00790413_04314 [Deinococcus hopiensis KR-140]